MGCNPISAPCPQGQRGRWSPVRFLMAGGRADAWSASRRSCYAQRQTLTRSLLVPNSAIRSTLALAPKPILGEPDTGQHRDVERKHEWQRRPAGSSLTMHDRDAIIDI